MKHYFERELGKAVSDKTLLKKKKSLEAKENNLAS